jgi:hypothetical protein
MIVLSDGSRVLTQLMQIWEERRCQVGVTKCQIGRLLEKSSRAAGLFDVQVEKR